MSWFVFSLITFLAWSGSDIFSKIGTKPNDKNSEFKVAFAVGVVMGLHFLVTLIGGAFIDNPETLPKFVTSLIYTDFRFRDFIVYAPIALLYILAMLLGYMGLRYIELSLSSPICNSSGSLALLICAVIWRGEIVLSVGSVVGVLLVSLGIIALSFVLYTEDEDALEKRQLKSNRKYVKSALALILPLVYLVLDALGTVGDQYLSALSEEGVVEISDYASNSAFELMFFCFAVVSFIVLCVRKDAKSLAKNRAVYLGGLCETVGQVFYMAVMFDHSDGAEVGMVIISAYCALSVLWSRLFLKEKLSWKHYLTIGITFIGIVLLGIFSEV